MLCILIFLRVLGKTQVSHLTPLDTINAFVIGAMVSGVIYDQQLSVWYFVFAIAVWAALNFAVRAISRYNIISKFMFGTTEYLVKDGVLDLKKMKENNIDAEILKSLLRGKDIFYLSDVDDVILETDGSISATTRKNIHDSFLLIDNGEIIPDALKNANKDETWLLAKINKFGFKEVKDLYCFEFTPKRGYFLEDINGNVMLRVDDDANPN
jgi:uncharacterized membrane protein YcaP (DUF421 family)